MVNLGHRCIRARLLWQCRMKLRSKTLSEAYPEGVKRSVRQRPPVQEAQAWTSNPSNTQVLRTKRVRGLTMQAIVGATDAVINNLSGVTLPRTPLTHKPTNQALEQPGLVFEQKSSAGLGPLRRRRPSQDDAAAGQDDQSSKTPESHELQETLTNYRPAKVDSKFAAALSRNLTESDGFTTPTQDLPTQDLRPIWLFPSELQQGENLGLMQEVSDPNLPDLPRCPCIRQVRQVLHELSQVEGCRKPLPGLRHNNF